MVEVKPFSKFGIWFPIVGILASLAVTTIIILVGYLFLNWKIELEVASLIIVALYVSFGLWACLAWKLSKTKLSEVFSFKKITNKNLIISIIVALASQAIFITLTYFVSIMLNEEIKGNAAGLLDKTMSPLILMLTVATAIFFAPVFEEILFRGLIFDGIFNTSKKLKASQKVATSLAFIISSILFGLAHVSSLDLNALVTFVATGAFGFYLAYLRMKTSSLSLSIITHAAFNTITVAILVVSL